MLRALRPTFIALAVVAAALPAVTWADPPVAPAPPRVAEAARGVAKSAPAQEPKKPAAPEERLESEHFLITYDPRKVTAEQARRARAEAEAAWERCTQVFPKAPESRIWLNLTPDFLGATGFASPWPSKPHNLPLVGVRYGDLEYLGLDAQYVITHEVGHVFSGDLAASPLGEGIADLAAASYAGVPQAPWWGVALRSAGLWIEPEALFVTGEFEQSPEVDARIRTALYAESGLLVQYLVQRFGWARFAAFAKKYSAARGSLQSNAERARWAKAYREGTLARANSTNDAQRKAIEERIERENEKLRPPDAARVRAVFEKELGVTWSELRGDWEAMMRREPVPAAPAARLILAQQIYGAVRNYEMWLREAGKSAPAERQELVRAAFTTANQSLRRGETAVARRDLERAVELVEALRRSAPPPPAKGVGEATRAAAGL